MVLPGSDAKTVEHIQDDSGSLWGSKSMKYHVSIPFQLVQLTMASNASKQNDSINNRKGD